jgi:hypothetical protein
MTDDKHRSIVHLFLFFKNTKTAIAMRSTATSNPGVEVFLPEGPMWRVYR